MPEINFFQLGVELDPAHQVIKKLKMDHLWVYTQNVIKKNKKACELLKF